MAILANPGGRGSDGTQVGHPFFGTWANFKGRTGGYPGGTLGLNGRLWAVYLPRLR